MPRPRLLILGGTGDAAELVNRVAMISEIEVINSLAGRTRQPLVSYQNTRIGGFGGVEGLINYLRQEQIDITIDATHPFADRMSFNAATAAAEVGIPYLMLIRPGWEPVAGDRWIEVANNEAAAAVLPGLGRRIFLTIGRQELSAFAHLQHLWFLMRSIDPPAPGTPVPPGKMLLERGPFTLKLERSRLQEYGIDAIVSKNSGGDATYAKIIAARELSLPVVMVQRPRTPEGDRVHTIEDALEWLRGLV